MLLLCGTESWSKLVLTTSVYPQLCCSEGLSATGGAAAMITMFEPCKVAPSLGMSMTPKILKLTDNRPAPYIQQLEQVIDMKHEASYRHDCYPQHKVNLLLKLCQNLIVCLHQGDKYANSKMGEEPWGVKISLKDTMVIG